MGRLFSFLFFGMLSGLAWAQGTSNSIQQTQQMMTDPQTRQQMLASPEAKNADKQVGVVTKGNAQQKEQIYQLAAGLFPDLAKSGSGDPQKMTEIMMKAMENPEAFYNTWTPEQKANFQKLVREMQGGQFTGSP
jgi:hypothetical protein